MNQDLNGKVDISDTILVSIPIITNSSVNINNNIDISNNIQIDIPIIFNGDITLPSGQIINSTNKLVDTDLQQDISNKLLNNISMNNPRITKMRLTDNNILKTKR